ncbi:NADP oxidoreductase [Planotetraspora thailandica]|uniref:NADP oxidoreductase n=1 Tax=Planotetraspora thailandica TaxID=487172 RepID=A0A8J3V4P4_9ACTN|nr:NADP oxidoreductase [Planotetraspora thailandica]
MTIGIIGAGAIGSAVAEILSRADIDVIVSNSRGPDTLADLARRLGSHVRAGTREQAAAQDIVFVAVNWSKIPRALAGLPDWNGRIVIDTNNSIEAPSFQPFELHGKTSSEVFADLVPGARVVKAFGHLTPDLLTAAPAARGGRRVLFLSGDDPEARRTVQALIHRLGFFSLDLGPLAVGSRLLQFPGGPLPSHHLVKIG